MATFTDKRIIDTLIANGGKDIDPVEPGERADPDVSFIVEYTNTYGNPCWGVTWMHEHPKQQVRYIQPSQFVLNPRIIWMNPAHGR